MGYFRELPDIAYQSPLPHKNSSRDFLLIKNILQYNQQLRFLFLKVIKNLNKHIR